MIKSLFSILALFVCTLSFAQNKGNYILVINGDSIYFDLDEEQTFTTPKGEKLNLSILQPNELSYSNRMVSFDHPKSLSVTSTEIEDGIQQCMVMNSIGNGYILQSYYTMDPTSLVGLMVKELSKESVSYGYKKVEKPFKQKLASGQTIEGTQAILTYKGDKEIYTVASYGGKDEGILLVTMLLNDDYDDQEMIDLFLNTLRIRK